MAKDSRIEWTHHTFNPWWGCRKVSPACLHCYAETWARRLALDLWGTDTPRRFFSEQHWREPLKWNREAERLRTRRRVFCASMADLFEGRAELNTWRERLWPLIDATPWLDWLLLTKRIHNVARMVPWGDQWPANVWLGTTAENQRWMDRRLPILFELNARVRFVSAEPLLGPVSVTKHLQGRNIGKLHWLITGGESGHGARPTHPQWVRALRDECQAHDVAFHFKQWGHWAPSAPEGIQTKHQITLEDARGVSLLYGLGKNAAGRVLDGRTWDQFPA